MRLAGRASWQMRINRWEETVDLALWIRAAERIEVGGALVPGALDIEPVPAPSASPGTRPPGERDELAAGWAAWWDATVREKNPVPRVLPDGAMIAPDLSFRPPDFTGLGPWPALREIALRRWLEAHGWHIARKRRDAAGLRIAGPDNGRVVREVERWRGEPVPPFVLQLIVLPVRDDAVRRVWEGRYLVPERVYDGPGWPDILQRMVVRACG